MTGKLHWARRVGETPSPGPGAYNIPGGIGTNSPRFTIRKRIDVKQTSETTPGPDFVDLSPRSRGPAFTIGGINDRQPESMTPGPDYMPDPLGAPKIRMNSPKRGENRYSPRKRKYESYNYSINGPALADLRNAPKVRASSPATMGVRRKNSWLQINDSPSPDFYEVKDSLTRASSPKYSLRASPKIIPKDIGPGPGGIMIPSDFGKKSMSIHVRHKELPRFDTPGPGNYEVSQPIGKSARSATISPRTNHRIHHFDYEELIKTPSIFDNPKGITIGEVIERPIPESPGPGDYNIDPIPGHPGHKITPKPTQKDIERMEELHKKKPFQLEEPGPATFNPNYKLYYSSGPKFSFGDKTEFQTAVSLKDNGLPGPQYDSTLTRSSPMFTIKGRNFQPDPKSATQDAELVMIEPPKGLTFTIGGKDDLELIPK